MTAPGSAEIFDRGYRAYDGPRAGVSSSMKAVFVSTVQRALGLRRKFRYKIVPLATIFIAYVPALVFLGITAILPSELAGQVVEEYAGYFELISVMMLLLTAFVVPEVMGADRKTGMFGLYMASPLNRWHYLAAKFVGIIAVLSLVTTMPSIFQMAGYSLLGIGPEGFVETIKTLVKIIASGFVLSIFFALFGMAASTLTNRHLFASAGIVMSTIATAAFADIITQTSDAPSWIQLISVVTIPLELIVRIWGSSPEFPQIEGVSTLASFGAWALACAVFGGVILYGYRRMEVTK